MSRRERAGPQRHAGASLNQAHLVKTLQAPCKESAPRLPKAAAHLPVTLLQKCESRLWEGASPSLAESCASSAPRFWLSVCPPQMRSCLSRLLLLSPPRTCTAAPLASLPLASRPLRSCFPEHCRGGGALRHLGHARSRAWSSSPLGEPGQGRAALRVWLWAPTRGLASAAAKQTWPTQPTAAHAPSSLPGGSSGH